MNARVAHDKQSVRLVVVFPGFNNRVFRIHLDRNHRRPGIADNRRHHDFREFSAAQPVDGFYFANPLAIHHEPDRHVARACSPDIVHATGDLKGFSSRRVVAGKQNVGGFNLKIQRARDKQGPGGILAGSLVHGRGGNGNIHASRERIRRIPDETESVVGIHAPVDGFPLLHQQPAAGRSLPKIHPHPGQVFSPQENPGFVANREPDFHRIRHTYFAIGRKIDVHHQERSGRTDLQRPCGLVVARVVEGGLDFHFDRMRPFDHARIGNLQRFHPAALERNHRGIHDIVNQGAAHAGVPIAHHHGRLATSDHRMVKFRDDVEGMVGRGLANGIDDRIAIPDISAAHP